MLPSPPLILAASSLARADVLVLCAYFALLIGTGIWFSRRKVRDTRDYFLANRSMPAWAVSLSILATAQSAATFVGVPQSSYLGDLTYLSSNIGGVIAGFILAWIFIPAYYRLGITTPYALLETRFGPHARTGASWAYLVGRVFASGARVFVGSLPACEAIFGDITAPNLCITIVIFMIFGILYTFVGGISSAIWTDVIQVCVYLGAAVVALVLLYSRIPGDASTIVHALSHPPPPEASKLIVISWSTDLSKEFTVFTVTTGFVLLTLASHGMDQDLVQRMLTCKNAGQGAKSVLGGVLIGIPTVILFLTLGLLLSIFYKRPDIMGSAAPDYAVGTFAFQTFAFREMQGGLAGLFLAGLFAAGPAGINSGLNSMSSTFVTDLYRRRYRTNTEAHYLRVGRLAVIVSGLAIGGFAMACIALYNPKQNTLIGFVLSVMNFAYAGLLGMFLIALFTRRGTQASALWALATGFAVVFLLQPSIWKVWTNLTPWLQEHVNPIQLAFPWHLVLGATAACLVCASKTRPPASTRQS